MNIVVTGASGFVGSRLCQVLSESGHKVYGCKRLIDFTGQSFYEEIHTDMSLSGWTAILPKHADIVIHLAQSKRYREFPDGADDMMRINVQSTFELLEWSRARNVKKFIYTSSGNVYKSTNGVLSETSDCVPSSMYAATKYMAELLVTQYAGYFCTSIFRPFGIYGPDQKDMLIANMINKLKKEEVITLASGEGIWMTPIFVNNAVEVICQCVNSNEFSFRGIFNLCGDEVVSLAKIVQILEKHTNIPARIAKNDTSPQSLLGNNFKLKQIIGQSSFLPIEEGLRRTLQGDYGQH